MGNNQRVELDTNSYLSNISQEDKIIKPKNNFLNLTNNIIFKKIKLLPFIPKLIIIVALGIIIIVLISLASISIQETKKTSLNTPTPIFEKITQINTKPRITGAWEVDPITKNTPKIINNLTNPYIENSENNDDSIAKNWQNYKNNVLGISFQYPTDWGDVLFSDTYRNLTHLADAKEFFLKKESSSTYTYIDQGLNINFTNNPEISLMFIYDEYTGDIYISDVNSKETELGNTFNKLKQTSNICDYHRSVKTASISMSEIYDLCVDNIKTVVTVINSSGSSNFKSEQFFFKKLNNGYFDNLLINNPIAYSKYNNQDELFPKNKLKDMNIFKKFVGTIKSFPPINPTLPVFKENPNEDKNLTLIRKYYYLIADQKLTEAFSMLQNPKFTFEDFTKWYSQVFNTKVDNINQLTSNSYKYDVDISEKNQPVSLYRVSMEVNNNKINTLSTEQITSKEVKFGEYVAYIRLKNDKNEVVLTRNGQESIIDSGDNDWKNKFATYKTFSDPTFSPMGTYLIYLTSGWEWSSPTLYNLSKGEKVQIDLSYAGIIFTKDEKYLISCTSAGIGSGVSAIIYAVPSFSIKKDFKDIINNPSTISLDEADCSYSSEKSEVNIVLSYGNKQIKTIKYNLISNQEVIE